MAEKETPPHSNSPLFASHESARFAARQLGLIQATALIWVLQGHPVLGGSRDRDSRRSSSSLCKRARNIVAVKVLERRPLHLLDAR